MKTRMTTCGSNWKVTVEVDPEICGSPYMEGATRALELVFGQGPDTSDEADIVIPDPTREPNLGLVLQVYKTEDEQDEEKHKYVLTIEVARNAGLLWVVEQLEKIMPKVKPGADL